MKRSILSITILTVSILTLAGCPASFEIALGSWVFDSPNFFYPAGFVLNANGTATNFLTNPSAEPWQGTWEWESDGKNLSLFDSSAADGFVFEGRLQSETTASGILRHADESNALVNWDGMFFSP